MTSSPSYATTYHQSKSLSLLRRMLNNPYDVQSYALLWSIVANMVLNQECGDCTGFRINLSGLKHVIAFFGGTDALRTDNLRASIFVEGLSKTLTNQSDSFSRLSTPQHHAMLLQQFSTPSSTNNIRSLSMPEGLSIQYHAGELSPSTAFQIHAALHLIRRSYQRIRNASTLPKQDDGDETIKFQVESDLMGIIDYGVMTDIEYILCVGVLIKLAATPPVGVVRQELCACSKVPLLIKRLADIASIGCAQDTRIPLLWTCLVIMEMPMNIPPCFGLRISLLKHVMTHISVWVNWEHVRASLAKIYLDDGVEPIWKRCWEDILQQSQ